jgi:hypothetical protein
MKHCPGCKQEKPRTSFAKNRGRVDGLQAHCKQCFSARYKKDPQVTRNHHLLSTYGLRPQDVELMLAQQQGMCAICRRPIHTGQPYDRLTSAHVDHDHETGAVRALLCHFCNAGLGYFMDSFELLHTASLFLEYFKHKGGK